MVAPADQAAHASDARPDAARQPAEARQIEKVAFDLGERETVPVKKLHRIGSKAERQAAAGATEGRQHGLEDFT